MMWTVEPVWLNAGSWDPACEQFPNLVEWFCSAYPHPYQPLGSTLSSNLGDPYRSTAVNTSQNGGHSPTWMPCKADITAMPFWTWSSLQASNRWLACGLTYWWWSGGIFPYGRSRCFRYHQYLRQLNVSDAGTLLNYCWKPVQPQSAMWMYVLGLFPFQKQYLFHPFPGFSWQIWPFNLSS